MKAGLLLFGERIRPNLELHELAGISLSAFGVERRSRCKGGPDAFSLPTPARVVDTSIDAFRVETHRVRHAERFELTVDEGQQTFRLVARRHRNVLSDAEHVEPIHEVVIRGIGTRRIDSVFEIRPRE